MSGYDAHRRSGPHDRRNLGETFIEKDLKQLKKLSDLKKLEATSQSVLQYLTADDVVTAIVQVNEPGYVPVGVDVRARISESIFTAEFRAAVLQALEGDPKVKSIALSRPQQLID